MALSITVDASKFRNKLAEYSRNTGRSLRSSIYETMAAICNGLIKNTFPNSMGEGKKRVDLDIRKVFIPLNGIKPEFFRNEQLRSRFEQLQSGAKGKRAKLSAEETMREILRDLSNGGKFNLIIGDFPDESFHQMNRDERGRVRKGARRMLVNTEASIKSYVSTVQTHIGKAKAGWMPAAKKFGATKIPGFVSRHSGEGSATDNLSFNSRGLPSGYVRATNSDKGAVSMQRRGWDIIGKSTSGALQHLRYKMNAEMRKNSSIFNRR